MVGLTNCCVTHVVVERFWDITNTFHFPFGEMSITPFDFVMLTDLGFIVEQLVYHEYFNFFFYRPTFTHVEKGLHTAKVEAAQTLYSMANPHERALQLYMILG